MRRVVRMVAWCLSHFLVYVEQGRPHGKTQRSRRTCFLTMATMATRSTMVADGKMESELQRLHIKAVTLFQCQATLGLVSATMPRRG